MRILVVGAGVIGSVYAGKLLEAGHEVALLARGRRLADLHASGLTLEEAYSGQRIALPVTAVAGLDPADRYDLVLVPVRSEQLTSTLPVLSSMRDSSDVLFFGNTADRQAQLVEALGSRVLFGFPAAGGTREGSLVRYVLIDQQQTMLGETTGANTSRTQHLKTTLQDAGHRQAFQALRTSGNAEIPANPRTLYLRVPATFAVGYWRRALILSRWRNGLRRLPRYHRTGACAVISFSQADPRVGRTRLPAAQSLSSCVTSEMVRG